MPELREEDRPWQADIDRVQQTLQEVLQAISSISGVGLPDEGANLSNRDESFTRMDFKTLKDRIRNDLEAFSVTTTAEISNQAKEQTQAALAAIKNEVSAQVQLLVNEYRDKLERQIEPEQMGIDLSKEARDRVVALVEAQTDEFARWVWLMCKGTDSPVPEQIEKLMAPYVEEATVKFGALMQQRVQDQLTQQDQLIQERLRGTVNSLEGQISTLEQAAQQICEQNADAVTKSTVEQLNSVAGEAAKAFSARIGDEAEGSFGKVQAQLAEISAAMHAGIQQESDRQAEGFRQKLEGMADEVTAKKISDVSIQIEQSAAAAIASSVQHLQQQTHEAVEHSKVEMKGFLAQQVEEVQGQVTELGQSMQESLSKEATRVADSLKGLDQELSNIRDRHLADSEEQLSSMLQATMESLTARLKQITDSQLEEISRLTQESQEKAAVRYESQLQDATEGHYNDLMVRLQKEAGDAGAKVVAEIKANSESILHEISDKVDASAAVLREEGIQASARIESALQDSLEACKRQLAQVSQTGLEAHQDVFAGSIAEIHKRLIQAAEVLIPSTS